MIANVLKPTLFEKSEGMENIFIQWFFPVKVVLLQEFTFVSILWIILEWCLFYITSYVFISYVSDRG